MCDKATIYPEPDGTFAFDNGNVIRVCRDKHSVGENLESMIWPMIEPALKAKKTITIKIETK